MQISNLKAMELANKWIFIILPSSGHPVALPTIAPFVARWSNLGDTHVNDENWWNFEKRIDTKVWWPSK